MKLLPAPWPYPASPEAVNAGCQCPVILNAAGKGAIPANTRPDDNPIPGMTSRDGKTLFWISPHCTVHGGIHSPKDRTTEDSL